MHGSSISPRPTVSSYSLPDDANEHDLYEWIPTTGEGRVFWSAWVDATTLTKDATFRLYVKVDGTTYRIFFVKAFTAATDVDGVFFDCLVGTNTSFKITVQGAGGEGAARALPYRVTWST